VRNRMPARGPAVTTRPGESGTSSGTCASKHMSEKPGSWAQGMYFVVYRVKCKVYT
jgi:hypothetical protein